MTNAAKTQVRPLSRDTNTALREVIVSMENLSNVYVEETQALAAIDTQKFLNLQEKKLDVARHYQAHMSEMIARKDEIKVADPSLRNLLKNMHAAFSDLSKENLDALERMARCTERLGDTIRNAAIRSARSARTFSYGENGTISNAAKNKVVSSGLSETA